MSGFIRTYVVYIVSERRVKSDGKNRDGYKRRSDPREKDKNGSLLQSFKRFRRSASFVLGTGKILYPAYRGQ